MSDTVLGREILRCVGFDEDYVNNISDDVAKMAINATSVTEQVIYLEESENGKLTQVNEETFNRASALTTGGPSRVIKEHTYGKLILKLRSMTHNPSYAKPGRQYSWVAADVEWTQAPNYQFTDLLTIACTGNPDNDFPKSGLATWEMGNLTSVKETVTMDKNNGQGTNLSLICDLHGLGVKVPIGILQQSQTLLKKATVCYSVVYTNDVVCQAAYAHSALLWTPSFSVSSSGSVSFGGLSIQRQTFSSDTWTIYYE